MHALLLYSLSIIRTDRRIVLMGCPSASASFPIYSHIYLFIIVLLFTIAIAVVSLISMHFCAPLEQRHLTKLEIDSLFFFSFSFHCFTCSVDGPLGHIFCHFVWFIFNCFLWSVQYSHTRRYLGSYCVRCKLRCVCSHRSLSRVIQCVKIGLFTCYRVVFFTILLFVGLIFSFLHV